MAAIDHQVELDKAGANVQGWFGSVLFFIRSYPLGALGALVFILFVATAIMVACTTGIKPLPLTYPHHGVDYGSIRNLGEISKQVLPYFVKVIVYADDDPSKIVAAGSGILIGKAGYVVTVAHIARDEQYSAVVTTVTGSTLPARVVHVDADNELALLRIAIKYQASTEPSYADMPSPGDKVFAIGTPPARSAIVTVGSVRTARLSKSFRYGKFGFRDPVVLAMYIDTGYSGGPVFNESGSCFGDSGGPVFRVDDEGKEIIVAVTSSGDGQCVATGLNYRVDIPYMLDWIYEQFPEVAE